MPRLQSLRPMFCRTYANAATPRVRRDVQSLSPSDPFFVEYGQAVQAMHQLPASDSRNWRNQSLIHLNRLDPGGGLSSADREAQTDFHAVRLSDRRAGQCGLGRGFIIPNYKQTWAAIRRIADAPEGVRHLTFKSEEYRPS